EALRRVTHAHRTPTEHVRRANQDRVPDTFCDRPRLCLRPRDPPLWAADVETLEQGTEPFAVLGDVDGVERRADDLVAGGLQAARELQRCLAAELDRDPFGPFPLADRQDFLEPEW